MNKNLYIKITIFFKNDNVFHKDYYKKTLLLVRECNGLDGNNNCVLYYGKRFVFSFFNFKDVDSFINKIKDLDFVVGIEGFFNF